MVKLVEIGPFPGVRDRFSKALEVQELSEKYRIIGVIISLKDYGKRVRDTVIRRRGQVRKRKEEFREIEIKNI